jgi:GNAT superfamily N-acetyltransferase
MTIRPMTPRDLPAGLDLCRLSHWNQLADDWRHFLKSAWLAEHDSAPLGTVALLDYGPFTWLSMMLVHPDHRRSGIGSRLLAAALDGTTAACIRLDATPAGEPLYRRFGFVPEYPLARATITCAGAIPPSAVTPMANADIPEVFALDAAVFGADRTAILAGFHRSAPELAALVRNRTTLRGYCFGRPGHLYPQMGPIVADSPGVARELVTYCLAAHRGMMAIDIPLHSPEWLTWLEAAGFTIERPFLRMRRGENRHAGMPERQFAIAGPEFG